MPILTIIAPTGGILRRSSYQTQPPFSSYDSVNYWPLDVKTGRITSGIRPPLTLFGTLETQVNMLSPVNGVRASFPAKSFAAAYNGQIYYWNGSTLVTATGAQAASVDTDVRVSATPVVNQLAICKSSAAPIILDYPTGAAATLVASAGTVPTDARICATWQGALWLAAGPVVYASRVGDITDWDYSVELADLFGAFYTDGDYKGVLAGPVTALMPQVSDTMIVGTVSGSLAMRGHPRQGGVFEAVSDQYPLGQGAWCLLPDSTLVMLTPLGLMSLSAQPNAIMTPISRDKIPDELVGILYDTDDPLVNLEYDSRWNQIHIYIRGPQEQAWLFDMNTGGYHKMDVGSYPYTTSNFSSFITESTSGLLLGRYDGLYQYDRFGTETIPGSLVVGPVKISASSHELSKVVNMRITFARDTPDAVGTIKIACGLDGQDAVSRLLNGTEQFSCDISKLTANNGMIYPSVTGHAMVVAITTEVGDVAIEEMTCEIIKMGRATYARSPQISVTGETTDFTGAFIELDPGLWTGYSELTPVELPDEVLPEHTHFLNLSLLPQEWWDAVQRTDGGDIRVSDALNQEVPVMVVDFSLNDQEGMLLFKMSQTTTPKAVRVWTGNANTFTPEVDSTYGQYNVFDLDYRAFWYDGGGESNITRYGDNDADTNRGANVVDDLEYGTVDGPLGASATDFDLGNITYWGISNWLEDQGLEAQTEWTFASAFYRTAGATADDRLLELSGNISNNINIRALISGSNAGTIVDVLTGTSESASSGSGGVATNNWRLHTGVVTSTTDRRAFIDGLLRGLDTDTKAHPTVVGLYSGSGLTYPPGRLALTQIHTVARSDAWAKFQGAMMDQVTFWGTIGDFVLVNDPPAPALDATACPVGIVPVTETGTWDGYASATPVTPLTSVVDFTHLVDLAAMPSSWWSAVDSTGIDIRVTDTGNNFLPFDLIEFDSTAETGLLTFKFSQQEGAPSAVRVWVGNSSAVAVSACASYGQYFTYDSAWRGFWPSGSGNDRTQFLNHLTATGSPGITEATSPVGSESTYYDNSVSTSQYSTTTNQIPTGAPITLMASVKHPSGALHQNSVIMAAQSSTSQSGVLLSTTPSPTPARLTTRNSFGSGITAGNSSSVSPTSFWFEAGTAFGAVSRLSYVNNTGSSYSSQGVVVLSDIDTLIIGAELATTPTRGWVGTISLAAMHTTARGSTWMDYWYKSLTQSTFWSTWTWTADPTALS